VLEYQDNLDIGDVELDQVNLAEDPDGPLNGWEIRAPIKNNGARTITYLNVEIQYLGPGGKVVETTKWPWVAPQFPVPMEEELKVPVKGGEARDYVYTTAPPEAGEWNRTVKLVPVTIRFKEKKGGKDG